jgi:hypothetical protein
MPLLGQPGDHQDRTDRAWGVIIVIEALDAEELEGSQV